MKLLKKIAFVWSLILCVTFIFLLHAGCKQANTTQRGIINKNKNTKPSWCSDERKLNTPVGSLWYQASAVVRGQQEGSVWHGTVLGESFLIMHNSFPIFSHQKITIKKNGSISIEKSSLPQQTIDLKNGSSVSF